MTCVSFLVWVSSCSLQRVVPVLCGNGVSNRRPGCAESHHHDSERQPSADLDRGPLQSLLAGNHPHRQPEEVSATLSTDINSQY